MLKEKSIVIGCDNAVVMTDVINGLRQKSIFNKTIISAHRVADLIGIAKSLLPDLIILCFGNNQHALKDLSASLKKPEIPILCLTKRNERETLRWDQNSIVFTYPLENIHKEEYLHAQIQSIFLLKTFNEVPEKPISKRIISSSPVSDTKNLSRYVMELDQKVEILLKVKERIADLYPRVDDPTRVELNSIVNSIKSSVNDNKLWEDFKLYFEKTNPNFLLTLAEKHPELTMKDLKYCCYLKMNMTNNDIRNLLGINQESVRTHKFRLKKKMALPKELDLVNYLRSVA
jgi:DNA-binding CsgD family transcriptional regulator